MHINTTTMSFPKTKHSIVKHLMCMMYAHICTQIKTRTHACKYTHTHTHTYTHTHTRTHIHTHTHTHSHTHNIIGPPSNIPYHTCSIGFFLPGPTEHLMPAMFQCNEPAASRHSTWCYCNTWCCCSTYPFDGADGYCNYQPFNLNRIHTSA